MCKGYPLKTSNSYMCSAVEQMRAMLVITLWIPLQLLRTDLVQVLKADPILLASCSTLPLMSTFSQTKLTQMDADPLCSATCTVLSTSFFMSLP